MSRILTAFHVINSPCLGAQKQMWTWRRSGRWSRKDPPQRTKPFMIVWSGPLMLARCSTPRFFTIIYHHLSWIYRQRWLCSKISNSLESLCQRWTSMRKPIYGSIPFPKRPQTLQTNVLVSCPPFQSSQSKSLVRPLGSEKVMKLCSCYVWQA